MPNLLSDTLEIFGNKIKRERKKKTGKERKKMA